MAIKVDISTIALSRFNYQQKLRNFKRIVEKFGFDFGIQLHNTIDEQLFDIMLNSRYKFSIHSPILENCKINLAGSDIYETKTIIETQISLAKRLKASYILFHGIFITDAKLNNLPLKTGSYLLEHSPKEYLIEGTRNPKKEYFESDLFREYFEKALKNLELIKDREIIICLENDVPTIGYGLVLPQQIKKITAPLCIDIGHLWQSSIIYDFDFYEELEDICKKRTVFSAHIVSNIFKKGDEIHLIRDNHNHLYEGHINFEKAIHILKSNGCNNYALEVRDADEQDVHMLCEILKKV